jgi:cell division protein FtsN
MSGEDYPAGRSGSLLGKEFIIVLVIVFSGVSFTLGYFVGRNTVDIRGEGIEPQPRPEQSATPQPVMPMPPSDQAGAGIPGPQPTQGASLVNAALPDSSAGREATPGPPGTTQGRKSGDSAPADAGIEGRTDEKSRRYTVQIGAFKSPAEARQMKAKFEKKGYESYISPAKDRKGQKIYKVKTGDFRDRKEAEVLALKLRKTEGLHTYVTTASE